LTVKIRPSFRDRQPWWVMARIYLRPAEEHPMKKMENGKDVPMKVKSQRP